MNKFTVNLLRGCLLFLAGSMILIWGIYTWQAYPYMKEKATERVKYLYELVQAETMQGLLTAFEEGEFDFDEENVHIMICDEEFRPVFISDPSKNSTAIEKRIRVHADKFRERAVPMYLQRNIGEPIVIRAIKQEAGARYYVYIYSKMKYAEMNILYAQKVMATVFVILFLVFACFALLYIKKETRLLTQMKEAVEGIKSGKVPVQIPAKVPDNEIGELATGINEVAGLLHNAENELKNYQYLVQNQNDDIAEFDVMQKRLFAKMTHHLKTPLAIVVSQLELEFDEKDPEKKKYYRDSIMEEIDKMSGQISELLAKTKEEPQGMKNKICRVNLSEFLQEMVPKYENWLSHNGILFTTEIEEQLYARIDVQQMEHAINNYIMNAFAHTKKGKKVVLRLFEEEGTNVLEVYNEGNGIADEDIESIWNSYYQQVPTKGNEKSSVGLGLYIVKDIVRQHGGECGVRNEAKGVTFWIKI